MQAGGYCYVVFCVACIKMLHDISFLGSALCAGVFMLCSIIWLAGRELFWGRYWCYLFVVYCFAEPTTCGKNQRGGGRGLCQY